MSDPNRSIAAALERVMVRAGLGGAVTGLERLSGGANMESWAFACGDAAYVLRRAPSAQVMAGRPLDHAAEAALIRAARAAGVPAPDVVAELAPADGIGTGFVMRRIAGAAAPGDLLAGGEELMGDIAAALAAIHRTPPPPGLPSLDPAHGVEGLAAQFAGFGGDRPIIALGLAWLRANLPPPVAPSLVHGDFRIGNLMAEPRHGVVRLTGVLDWEIAHTGDHHEDLAYGCMAVWRFGSPRPGFGLGTIEDWLTAYAQAGGKPVNPHAFRFWLVYRTVWWALGCLGMGQTWRSGADRSIERVVVARRTSEQELDLLLLLEDEAPAAERARPLADASAAETDTAGEPSAAELLTAVTEWLAAGKDRFEGRARFEHAVARNALGIAIRELTTRPSAADRALAEDILARRVTLATPGLLADLRGRALAKLAADQPKYPSLAIARETWQVS